MTSMRLTKALRILALGVLAGVADMAMAADFPVRPMTMIVPFAAGGPTDVLGRAIAQRMGEVLGQTIVVENVGGAGGMIGAKRVAEAKPDGYTFGIGTLGTHAQNQTLYEHPLYNSSTDFTPVALIAEVPIALIVRKNLPANNLQEFSKLARANGDKLKFGSGGVGAASHLACVLLNSAMGTLTTHVPYKGAALAMQDIMGGRIDFECEILSSVKSHVDAGTVKALAIFSKDRSPVEPDIPTAIEQGTNLEAYTWNALFLPRGVPEAVVMKLNHAVLESMHTSLLHERLQKLGIQIVEDERATPAYLAQFVKSETAKWAAPIKASGLVIK